MPLKRYNITVTRVSGYSVVSESPEEALDLVFGGGAEENGEETVGHTIEEAEDQSNLQTDLLPDKEECTEESDE